jgi:hypothetical protein
MFDDLFNDLNDLPYDEQQLLLKINELILKAYSYKNKSFGRKEAISMLKGILNDIQNSIDEDTFGKSK